MEMIRKSLFTRRTGIAAIFILLIVLAAYMQVFLLPKDYSRLVDFIKLEDKEEPLYAVNDFKEGFDEASHRASLAYLNEHPQLIKRIQTDLNGDSLRWRLDSLSHRLLFVPETRAKYATLFEGYCNDVIDDLVRRTGLRNPYCSIQTLHEARPEISGDWHGIKAFIVHDLIDEYAAGYVFFNKKNKKVKIQLKGKVSVGEVGSYKTRIYQGDNGTFEFVSSNYTIWQNSARNPYTALMVPFEETLHIALRTSTEQAIKRRLKSDAIKDMKQMEGIAKEWMEVEEAIVGGLVYAIFPPVLEKYVQDLPHAWIQEDLKAKIKSKRYRFLKRGIEVVKRLGYRKALNLYKAHPSRFRALLNVKTAAEGNGKKPLSKEVS